MRLPAFFLYSFLFSSQLSAEVAPTAPSLSTWRTEFSKVDVKTIVAPSRVVIVKNFSENNEASGFPVFLEYDHNECAKSSFWTCASFKEARLAAQINQRASSLGVSGAAKMSRSDAVVFALGNKVFFSNSDSTVKQQLKINVKDLAKIDLLNESIIDALGYDGVVLDIKEGYFLVGSVKSKLEKEDAQGLLLASSSKAWSMKGAKRKGNGLVHLVEKSEGFAVFQEIIGNKAMEPISIGSKLILESKKVEDSTK